VITDELRAFVRANLPPPPARLLEIGAGRGDLALALGDAGYDVVAIDPDPRDDSAVAVLPVPLHELGEPDGSFDAAVAVVSLHHVHPLEESCTRLAELVHPGGTLVVDELDVHQLDEHAAAWWLDRRRELGHDHEREPRAIVDELRAELHPIDAIVEALAPGFAVGRPLRCSYLHRWELDESLRPTEEALIAQGRLPAVGVRFVAVRLGESSA
jgi:SAM-dependent methyltransferase